MDNTDSNKTNKMGIILKFEEKNDNLHFLDVFYN